MHRKAKVISLQTFVLLSKVRTSAAALEGKQPTCMSRQKGPSVLANTQLPLKPQIQLSLPP